MIRRAKNINKIIIMAIMIIPIIYVIQFIVGLSAFAIIGARENKENKIAINYESSDSRNQYFINNQEYFNNLENILVKYKSIKEIDTIAVCLKKTYKYKNIIVCSDEPINNLPIKEIEKNFEKINLSSILINDNNITFRLVNTPENRVWFNYCIDSVLCENTNNFANYSYGVAEENIINEHWGSYYSNIRIR